MSICVCMLCIHLCARDFSFLHTHALRNTPDCVFNKRHDLLQDLGIKISLPTQVRSQGEEKAGSEGETEKDIETHGNTCL
jgi:hypothetical protein